MALRYGTRTVSYINKEETMILVGKLLDDVTTVYACPTCGSLVPDVGVVEITGTTSMLNLHEATHRLTQPSVKAPHGDNRKK